jgi:hypothetical protein
MTAPRQTNVAGAARGANAVVMASKSGRTGAALAADLRCRSGRIPEAHFRRDAIDRCRTEIALTIGIEPLVHARTCRRSSAADLPEFDKQMRRQADNPDRMPSPPTASAAGTSCSSTAAPQPPDRLFTARGSVKASTVAALLDAMTRRWRHFHAASAANNQARRVRDTGKSTPEFCRRPPHESDRRARRGRCTAKGADGKDRAIRTGGLGERACRIASAVECAMMPEQRLAADMRPARGASPPDFVDNEPPCPHVR